MERGGGGYGLGGGGAGGGGRVVEWRRKIGRVGGGV